VPLHPGKLAFVSQSGDLRAVLRAAALFMAKETKDAARNAVRFESDGATLSLVATNGHCLFESTLSARQSELAAGNFDLHRDSVAEVLKWLSKQQSKVPVMFDAQAARVYRVTAKADGVNVHPGDTAFVPWRNMIARLRVAPVPTATFSVSGNYLKLALSALTGHDTITISTHGEDTMPILVRGEAVEGQAARIYIAPCRRD
jgi:hypothetical protein